jgi:hypothetical protein
LFLDTPPPFFFAFNAEAFDFGYPQVVDAEVLKSYILQGKPMTMQKVPASL